MIIVGIRYPKGAAGEIKNIVLLFLQKTEPRLKPKIQLLLDQKPLRDGQMN